MATDAPASPSSSVTRSRSLLLVVLGIVLVAILWMNFGSSGGPAQPPAVTARAAQQREAEAQKLDPAELDVKVEALAGERPALGDTERNPFRFKPKPAPPPPKVVEAPPTLPAAPIGPPQPPAPPPITVKFIGTLQLPDGGMVAVFTDCTVGRTSVTVRESATILGQYRLVKIGLTSVVVEHLDGR